MAIATMNTSLMYKTGTPAAYTKLVDIIEFPDLGGEPERIDVTTLSDTTRKYIQGVEDPETLEFKANYTKSDYNTIAALTGTQEFAVYFGSSGADGTFTFTGTISVRVDGGGVNEAVTMTISIIPNSSITGA